MDFGDCEQLAEISSGLRVIETNLWPCINTLKERDWLFGRAAHSKNIINSTFGEKIKDYNGLNIIRYLTLIPPFIQYMPLVIFCVCLWLFIIKGDLLCEMVFEHKCV